MSNPNLVRKVADNPTGGSGETNFSSIETLSEALVRRKTNLIINGSFDLAQRLPSGSTPITSTGGNYLTVDRWLVGHLNVTGPTTQRTGNAVVGPKGIYQASSSGTMVAGSRFIFRQRIEASTVRSLALDGKSVSVGFWANLSGGVPERIRVGLSYPGATDDWTTSTEFYDSFVASAAGYNYYRFENIPLHANCTRGLRLDIYIESVSFAGAIDMHLMDVMLNEGSEVAPFERAGVTVAQETQLCQRYYEIGNMAGFSDGSNSAVWASVVRFSVEKRAAPTMTFGTQSHFNGGYSIAGNLVVSSGITTYGCSATRNPSGAPQVADQTQGVFFASAEL